MNVLKALVRLHRQFIRHEPGSHPDSCSYCATILQARRGQ